MATISDEEDALDPDTEIIEEDDAEEHDFDSENIQVDGDPL